jgi:hypothetical protein
MTPDVYVGEGYARLPEDLLAELLSAAPQVAHQVHALLGPALEQRGSLRVAAVETGLVMAAEDGEVQALSAVDGGFAVERTVAVDIALSVAVGIEGFAPQNIAYLWSDNQYNSAFHVLAHDMENERLARAAMVALELDVLADAPHDMRVYDGSHLTPVIQLNAAMTVHSNQVRQLVAEVADKHDVVGALSAFAEDDTVLAMPKYDSSRHLCALLGTALGIDVPGDDKYIASLILRGGEYLVPQRVAADPWRQLHIDARAGSPPQQDQLGRALDAALRPLQERQLYWTYFKPDDTSSAYRIEIKPALAADSHRLADLLATLSAQITGPFIREPYPQYLADVMAKSVGYGLDALQTATQLSLARENPELAQLVVHSYRTEGI